MTNFTLYYAALQADDTYQAELIRAYGPKRAADARYGRHTDLRVIAASSLKRLADEAWLNEMRKS